MKETKEDEVVNKIVEKAAVDAAARTAQGDVSPQVQTQEGQQFAATPGVSAEKEQEPVTTEAAIVAPTAGGRVGDRLVDLKTQPKKTKKVSQVVKRRTVVVPCNVCSYPPASCGS